MLTCDLTCDLTGDKHSYSVQPSPYNFIVFKCTLCPKYCYIPKVIFYKQMMALGVYNPHIKPKEDNLWSQLTRAWNALKNPEPLSRPLNKN